MKKALKILKIIFVLAITYSFLKICSNTYRADLAYEKARNAIDEGQLSVAFDQAERAIKLNPLEPNYYRMRARVLVNYLPRKEKTVRAMTKQLIVQDLENAYNLNRQNLVTIRNLVPLYYFIAAENLSAPASPENIDPYFLEPAKNFYANVKNYSPNDAGVYALIAKYEKRLNLMDEYNSSVETVRKLRPDLVDWFDAFQ